MQVLLHRFFPGGVKKRRGLFLSQVATGKVVEGADPQEDNQLKSLSSVS